jgi:cytochrome c oxidase subunit 2
VAVFFSLAIALAIVVLAVKYRQGAKADRSRPPQYNVPIEIAWTTIPLLIAMGIFVWSAALYFRQTRIPDNALPIQVVGKQWMWKLQQPTGRWENNELHVPVGKPVVLNMTSEDVIHSFFVPEFRLKQDVIPGQFTKMWFTPSRVGAYHLFCAQFCGTMHSGMVGTVYVQEQADYDRWLAEGKTSESVAAEGERLFRMHGCSGCHAGNGSVRAPLLEGIYGKMVPVQVIEPGKPLEQTQATTILADLRYLHDSIVLPEKEVAAGYKPIMPTFKNRLSEEEILKLIAYIRSMGEKNPSDPGRTDNTGGLSEEDYRARTGFVPPNINQLKGGGAGLRGQGGSGNTAPQPERMTQ